MSINRTYRKIERLAIAYTVIRARHPSMHAAVVAMHARRITKGVC